MINIFFSFIYHSGYTIGGCIRFLCLACKSNFCSVEPTLCCYTFSIRVNLSIIKLKIKNIICSCAKPTYNILRYDN